MAGPRIGNPIPDNNVATGYNPQPIGKTFGQLFCDFCQKIWQGFRDCCNRICQKVSRCSLTNVDTNHDARETSTIAETITAPGKQQNGVPPQGNTINTEEGEDAIQESKEAPGKTPFKTSGSADRIAKRETDRGAISGQFFQNGQEISYQRPAETGENISGSGNKISRTEQSDPKHSCKEDVRQEETNEIGKDKETDSGFEHSSKERQEEDLKQEHKESPTQKVIGSAEQACLLPKINEEQQDFKQGSFDEVGKDTDASLSKTTKISIGQKVSSEKRFNKEGKHTDTIHPKRIKSSIDQGVVILIDEESTDSSSPKRSKSSAGENAIKQANLPRDDRHNVRSSPKTSKSSADKNVVTQERVTNDDKCKDAIPPKTSKNSLGQNIFGEGSLKKDDKYANTEFGQKVGNDGQACFIADDKHKDTSLPRTVKSSVGEKVARPASFTKEDKYADTDYPPKTSKSSIEHLSEELKKVVAKEENNNENLTNTRPSSSTVSIGQGGQFLSEEQQMSVVKQEGVSQSHKIMVPSDTDMTKSSIGQASKEQQKEVPEQDKTYESHRNTRPDPSGILNGGSRQQASIPMSEQKGFQN